MSQTKSNQRSYINSKGEIKDENIYQLCVPYQYPEWGILEKIAVKLEWGQRDSCVCTMGKHSK